MTMRSIGCAAITVSLGLAVFGCTRENPSFGDRGADGSEGAATEATSGGSFTGGATDSASGGSQTTADATGAEGGESGGAGVCGDDFVDENEECDKGAGNSNVGPCKLDCTLNVCGDGFVGPDEACDQPQDVDQQFCTHDCTLPTCGNGMLDRMEDCDPSAGGGTGECTRICTLNVCGDTFVGGDEQCDNGIDNADGAMCKADCTHNVCGDGFVLDGVEECDGNVPEGLTCMGLGFFAGEPACDPMSCQISTEGCHNCGNGEVDEGEQCDPASPNGPNDVATPCANTPGWMGMGTIYCSEACIIGSEGGCCLVDGQECSAELGTSVFCCSQFCDENAGMCGG